VDAVGLPARETVAIAYGATDADVVGPFRRTDPTSRGPPTV